MISHSDLDATRRRLASLLPSCRLLITALILFCSLGASPGCGDREESETTKVSDADRQAAVELTVEADRALNRGDYEKAWQDFRRARERDPENARAQAAKVLNRVSPQARQRAVRLAKEARQEHRKGGIGAALPKLEQAYLQDPNNADLLSVYGNGLAQVRRFRDAATIAQRSIAIYPARVDGHWLMAQLEFERGEFKECLASLERLSEMSESARKKIPLGRLQVMKASSLVKIGSFEQALPLLKDLLRRNPSSVADIDRLSSFYEDTKNYDDALPLLEQLTSREQVPFRILMRYGLALEHFERFEEAAAAFERAAKAPEGPGSAWAAVARAYSKTSDRKNWEKGLAALDKFLDLRPQDPAALNTGTTLHKKLGNSVESSNFAARQKLASETAAATLKKGLNMKDRLNAASATKDEHLEYLLFAQRRGDIVEARRTVDKMLRTWPGDPAALFWSARLLIETGATEKGYWEALQLLAASPDDARGFFLASLASYRLGDFQNAARFAEFAVNRDPGTRARLEWLDTCYRRLGDQVPAEKRRELDQLLGSR